MRIFKLLLTLKVSFIALFIISAITLSAKSNFLKEQMRYKRVRIAMRQKKQLIINTLKRHHIKLNELNIVIIIFKKEKVLEIFAKNKSEKRYKKIVSYHICRLSGGYGPKRAHWDFQVPEGFYHINRFNPVSRFYLSLGINYPNKSDRIRSKFRNLGGNIFIHGGCRTIGCVPMTNDKIKEIYLYAVFAKNNGQRVIPVYIFPFEMTDEKFKKYEKLFTNKFSYRPELVKFWKNLKLGYDKFMRNRKELKFSVTRTGEYKIY